MFNQKNTDNRQRYLIRGRVVVFTDSKSVEFLEESLRHSYPLYSADSYPVGMGLVFLVEVSGYLTFDESAFVKISPELNPFREFYFDPTACQVVRPADPVQAPAPVLYIAYIGSYLLDSTGAAPVVKQAYIAYGPQGAALADLRQDVFDLNIPHILSTGSTDEANDYIVSQMGIVGDVYKGRTGYPGFTFHP